MVISEKYLKKVQEDTYLDGWHAAMREVLTLVTAWRREHKYKAGTVVGDTTFELLDRLYDHRSRFVGAAMRDGRGSSPHRRAGLR